jgi:hypothetical protein
MSNNNIPSRNTTKTNDDVINQIDEPFIEQSLSDDKTINPIVNIKGILKKPDTDLDEMMQRIRLNQIAKNLTMLTFIICYAPIILGNLYFAYTDDTYCISRHNPLIGLTLFDYLSIQAYVMSLTLALITLSIVYEPKDDSIWKTIYDNYILCYRAFSAFWLVFGIIIFAFLTYKQSCNNHIYYYLIITISIMTFTWVAVAFIHFKQLSMDN